MGYRTIEVEPAGAPLGAEVRGVDLSGPPPDAAIAEIREALLAHQVLFFRDQHLSIAQHMALGRCFGELDVHPYHPHLEGHPEVLVLETDQSKPTIAAGDAWHADLTALERPPLSDLMPALAEASRTVGSPQIRNRGTLGGNLGTASPAGDAIPPLLAGHARVRVASVDGERELPLAEFLTGPRQNALRANELIAGIRLEQVRGPQTFMKVGPRMAMAIAVGLFSTISAHQRSISASSSSAGTTALTKPISSAWPAVY